MQGRDLEREPRGGTNEECPGLAVARKQTGPGDGRKWDCTEQFGIVRKSMTVISIGPCPVEDVLPVGMRLGIEGHGTQERCALPEREIARRPTRPLSRTPRLVKPMQHFVPQQALSSATRLPRSH